jgi:hypothetical protein
LHGRFVNICNSIIKADNTITSDLDQLPVQQSNSFHSQDRANDEYKNDDEDLDLFKINKEQDPRVASPDIHRENITPIANSALINRQKPTESVSYYISSLILI